MSHSSSAPAPAPAPSSAALSLSPHERRRIAVAAGCDPDCVRKYVAGGRLRSTTIDRIEKAMRNLNFDKFVDMRGAALAKTR